MLSNMSIMFYNYFHNGDLIYSKSFVKEIIESIPVDFFYAHYKNTKIFQDLNLTQINPTSIPQILNGKEREKITIINDHNLVLVNTWIGAYLTPEDECTLNFNYKLYGSVYTELNKIYGLNLRLKKDKKEYFPTVDFNKINRTKVDEFLTNYTNKKILICNGPALSNQCFYNGDMKDLVIRLANTYTNIIFICTQKFNTNIKNIIFTDDINNRIDFDLTEISYLSTFCDIIVGRNSGPYAFSELKENIKNKEKKFICFGDRIKDCFQYGINTDSKLIFEQFTTLDNLFETIKREI